MSYKNDKGKGPELGVNKRGPEGAAGRALPGNNYRFILRGVPAEIAQTSALYIA